MSLFDLYPQELDNGGSEKSEQASKSVVLEEIWAKINGYAVPLFLVEKRERFNIYKDSEGNVYNVTDKSKDIFWSETREGLHI